jgi:hypothetical protein
MRAGLQATMSPFGPTPPATGAPSFTATHGEAASGYVKFTAALAGIDAATPTTFRGYGSTVRLVSCCAAALVDVTAATVPIAPAPLTFRNQRREAFCVMSPSFGQKLANVA